MYFKESTNNSRILTSEPGDKFYIREQRVKLRKKRELPTNESQISSQSSIYGNNVTLEDSIERSFEHIKPSKQDLREKGGYPSEHVHIQAEGKLKCACTICTAQNMLKTEPDDAFTDPFFVEHQGGLNGNVISNERGFIFVLKRLMPPRHFSQSLGIKIPETLVYLNGEAKFFVLTGKDKTMKFMSQREKLAQHEIKKFFNDRFAQKDEEQRVFETRNTLESRKLVLTSNDVATERTQGIELRKGTPTAGLVTGRSARHRTSRSMKIKSVSSNREVALLKFNDDSTTILCDAEFECLMAKKKFDPYWKNIAFIQNYRAFSKYIHTLQRVYFLYDREKENPLFARAAIEIHQMNQEVSPSSDSYIPAYEEDEFQKNLRNHNESEYCLYLIMKVYHFIEIVHGIRIVKMCGEFVKDTFDSLWLTNVSHLQYLPKVVDENHIKGASVFRMETEEKFSLDDSTALRDTHRKDDVNVLTELMQKQYENIKRGVALKEPVVGYEEDISDNIFAQLYPNAPYKLSLLLKNPKNNNPKNISSDTSFRAGTMRRLAEDEKTGPIKGVYLGMTKNTPQAANALSHNTSGNQSNRSIVRSRIMRVRADSTVNTSRTGTGRTLPSLGNIDASTNVTAVPEPKKQVQKKENTRSNSQPNLKKVFRFYGISPSMNQYPKIPNETFKEAHPRMFKKTPSEILTQIHKAPKLTTVEGDCFTERCTPIADGQKNSNPNTPYVKGLRGLSRGLQDKLVGQLDHGSSTRRSQSVHKKTLGYILNN